MDLIQILQHLDGKLDRLDSRLDKLDDKLDNKLSSVRDEMGTHSERLVNLENDQKAVRGSLKLGLSFVIGLFTLAGGIILKKLGLN